MRKALSIIIFFLTLGYCLQFIQAGENPLPKLKDEKRQKYDGNWWLSLDSDVQSGFLNGAADCLTWTAHLKGFSNTPDQMQEKITRYFETHPSEKTMPVIDVWRKLAEGLTSKNPSEGGKTWKNAHWYLNGLWWRQTSELEHIGFLIRIP